MAPILTLKHIPQTATLQRNIVRAVGKSMSDILTHITNNNIDSIVSVFQQNNGTFVCLYWTWTVHENGEITQTFFDKQLFDYALAESRKNHLVKPLRNV